MLLQYLMVFKKGKSLLEIAALMEVPYSENSSWNKNMVKRIIENDRYLGTEKYPQIIDKRNFQTGKRKTCQKSDCINRTHRGSQTAKTNNFLQRMWSKANTNKGKPVGLQTS